MATPLMKQYQQVKAKHPDTILLFRMGDFYETFEEDAKTAARVLGITLTKRGNGAAGEVPLAGFPYHALDAYLPKLLKAGHRVAICEQMEDPRFAVGLVKRDVVEVVTPGVSFSDKVLEQKQNNYLAAVALPSPLAQGDEMIGFAFIDVSTAEFGVTEFPFRNLADQIHVLQPSELLVQKRDLETLESILRDKFRGLYTKVEDWVYNGDYSYEILVNHFKTQSLKGFGVEHLKTGLVAAGAVMHYLQETQKANLPHLRKVTPFDTSDYMVLDASTKRNLEITASLSGQSDGTLFAVLDRTQTAMGGRLLKAWVNRPLKKLESIRRRLDAVKELFGNDSVRSDLRDVLGQVGDLERLVARIATGRANPRELKQLERSLTFIPSVKQHVGLLKSPTLAEMHAALNPLDPLVKLLHDAIEEDPPLALVEGGVIRVGYSKELDDLRTIAFSGKDWIAKLQAKERQRTGIPSLKVGYNNVFGYYIEITNTHKDKIPADYIRKQTLTNAERYITPDLKEYEEKVLHAEEKILALETRIFSDIRISIAEYSASILDNARLLATFDCFVALADVAVESNFVCPEVDDSTRLEIREGRHPVIERLLPPGERYTANNTLMDTESDQILIITGPNMSGKSSYLRQVGLIVLLAQIGSFVPAAEAKIGLVDRIYTRVGASDNIASGESTFLVEMHEAATIVNTSTSRGLILLDEVGRGTSTFDGISIAWALTEYLHTRIGAKTLFATHYHELNELADIFPRIKNYKVDVREYGDKVLFLHKVVPGFADHSYGIQVAQMAGLPEEVTDRAKKILKNLEESDLNVYSSGRQIKGRTPPPDIQMTLFEVKDERLREEIRKLDVENMTPLEALQKLTEIKRRLDQQ
ncbi:MAG: DNA mismatch repair protein MutS [Ignavibacteriales bacterium]|nr:DNA mismatch repair protein MutS [Ignavibacteriales bacterium]